MRNELGILFFALVVGGILFLACLQFGIIGAAPLVFGLAVVVGVLFSSVSYMAQNAMPVPELVKQIAVWFGVVVLLPLAVWYGTSVLSPPPDWKKYSKSEEKLNERMM